MLRLGPKKRDPARRLDPFQIAGAGYPHTPYGAVHQATVTWLPIRNAPKVCNSNGGGANLWLHLEFVATLYEPCKMVQGSGKAVLVVWV